MAAARHFGPVQSNTHAACLRRALDPIRADQQRLRISQEKWRWLPTQALRAAGSLKAGGGFTAERPHLQVHRLGISRVGAQHRQGPLVWTQKHLVAFTGSDRFSGTVGDQQILVRFGQLNGIDQLFAWINEICGEHVGEAAQGEGIVSSLGDQLRPTRFRGHRIEAETDVSADGFRTQSGGAQFRSGCGPQRKSTNGMVIIGHPQVQLRKLCLDLLGCAAKQPTSIGLSSKVLILGILQGEALRVAVTAFQQQLHHVPGPLFEVEIQQAGEGHRTAFIPMGQCRLNNCGELWCRGGALQHKVEVKGCCLPCCIGHNKLG